MVCFSWLDSFIQTKFELPFEAVEFVLKLFEFLLSLLFLLLKVCSPAVFVLSEEIRQSAVIEAKTGQVYLRLFCQ